MSARQCRRCQAAIVFVESATTGKLMPLDAKPEKRVVVGDDGKARVVYTFTSHFSTCPSAAEFRKPKEQA